MIAPFQLLSIVVASAVTTAALAAESPYPQTPAAYGVVDQLPPIAEGVAPLDLFASPPPVDGPAGVRLAQSTEAVARPLGIDRPLAANPALPQGPPPGRRGIVQGMDLSFDWSPALENDSLGRSTMSGSIGLGVPPMLLGVPLLVTPRAAIHTVEGPSVVDAPARLYDLELSVGTFKKLSPRWSARANVSVGVYGDDESLDESDALRVSGLGLAIFDAAPAWQWAFGVAYLNRDDISVLPVAGVIHDRGDVRFELMMPRPRIVWRLPHQGPSDCDRSFYVGGEFGGGAWAVRRTTGVTDTLNLSRYGLMLGYERAERGSSGGPPGSGGWRQRYEIGYLFGQSLEYRSDLIERSLDDSFIARATFSF